MKSAFCSIKLCSLCADEKCEHECHKTKYYVNKFVAGWTQHAVTGFVLRLGLTVIIQKRIESFVQTVVL